MGKTEWELTKGKNSLLSTCSWKKDPDFLHFLPDFFQV